MSSPPPVDQMPVLATNSGLLIDDSGSVVLLISVNEFHDWWNYLESSFESPIGRKLIYAASDDEEYFLENNPSYKIPKWFGKNKIVKSMKVRWTSMGWGIHLPEIRRIQSPCHDSLSAGLGLAHHEHVDQQRYRMEWRQVHSDLVELDFTKRMEDIPTAPMVTYPEWVVPIGLADIHTKPHEHEFEPRSFGFFWGQQRSIFLPTSILHRLFESIMGRPFNSERRPREGLHVTGISENPTMLFKALIESSSAMFDASDYSIFIQNQDDWESHLQHNICSRGFGDASVEDFAMDEGPTVRMTIRSPVPTFAIGLMVGMWERAHGAPCMCRVEMSSDLLTVSLYPRSVDYA